MLKDAGRAATLCPPLISEENLTLKNAELEGRMKPIPSVQRRDEERDACSEILRLFSYILHHINVFSPFQHCVLSTIYKNISCAFATEENVCGIGKNFF